MGSDTRQFTALFVLPLIFLLLISCSSTNEQRNTVGMRLLGEASEIETSLSGDPMGAQSSVESTTSTAPSSYFFSEATTTSVVGIVTLPKTTTPTTTTTLFIETPDKPFHVATAINETVKAFSKKSDSEARWILSNPGPFQGDRVFLVRNIGDEWIEVSMPIRPHGTNAWIKRDSVLLAEHKAKVIVDKYTGLLEGWANGELLFKESFTSGSEQHPTPLGDFYINEISVDRTDTSSAKLVGITAFSTTIDPTSEGDPSIAFLANPASEGSEELTSRGCIRVSSKVLNLLSGLPLGTPVQIVG